MYLLQKLRTLLLINILYFTERRTIHTAVHVNKIVNKISPPYLHGCFSFAVDVTGHPGRNVRRLFIPRVKTNYGKQSLAYRGAIIWNRLSSAIHGLKEFRTLYCSYVIICVFVRVLYLYCLLVVISGHS